MSDTTTVVEINYLTAAELANVLETGLFPKTTGRFRRDEADEDSAEIGFCCLGVYAESCGIPYAPETPTFSIRDSFVADEFGYAEIPEDHWLRTEIRGDMPERFQSFLADLNDRVFDFGPVIAALRDFDRGVRSFEVEAYIMAEVDVDD